MPGPAGHRGVGCELPTAARSHKTASDPRTAGRGDRIGYQRGEWRRAVICTGRDLDAAVYGTLRHVRHVGGTLRKSTTAPKTPQPCGFSGIRGTFGTFGTFPEGSSFSLTKVLTKNHKLPVNTYIVVSSLSDLAGVSLLTRQTTCRMCRTCRSSPSGPRARAFSVGAVGTPPGAAA